MFYSWITYILSSPGGITTVYKSTNILPESDVFLGIILSETDLKKLIFALKVECQKPKGRKA